MTLLFWCSVLGVAYSYLLYPLVLLALPKRRPAPSAPAETPLLSVVVTVHNEERRIRAKLENTLATDYPADRLEVIVASDASTDGTDAVAESFAARGVRLVRAPERRGKEHAQLLAVRASRGEVLVFSDAATDCPPGSFRRLAGDFADPAVGAVSSEDRLIRSDGSAAGEGAYIRYEMWLRRLESAVHGLVGLSGSFFAVRRGLCDQWDTRVPSDFNTALNCARRGFVAITDPEVIGEYPDIQDETREYRRKVRTVLRGLSTVFYHPGVLNPFRFGLFAFQVWSHKIFRWLVPWFLLGLLIASAALAGQGWIYSAALAAQAVCYALALLGWLSPTLRRSTLFKIPYFFTQVNLAIAHATVTFLGGRRVTVWSPSAR
jgi:cellulose synthase/poly-beta-1,6-N-acetylglucosamine synthase-like glycosyltransferase